MNRSRRQNITSDVDFLKNTFYRNCCESNVNKAYYKPTFQPAELLLSPLSLK